MLLNHFLERSAERFPDKVALVCGQHRWTYQELEQQANRWAHALADHDIRRHERVVLCLENSLEAVIGLFGTWKAGCVAVPVHPQVKTAKLEYVVNDCGAAALLTDHRRLVDLPEPVDHCPSLRLFVLQEGASFYDHPVHDLTIVSLPDLFQRYSGQLASRYAIDADLASLIYTSGSTGRPKGVMLTHANMAAAADSIMTYLDTTPDDIILSYLPLAFDYGLYQALMACACGGTLILERAFIYPYQAVELLQAEHVTGFPLVPAMAALLLQLYQLDDLKFPSLRYLTSTAQALPVDHIRRLRAIFPRARLFSMYGLTECKRVSYLPPEELDRRPTSVGRPMPNTEAFLVDDQGRRITTPDTPGELVVRGSNVMQGYWNLPEETAQRLRPGLHPGDRLLYTGDLFQMDEDGFLYFIARKDNLIKSGGELISPREVENALYALEDVTEAVVVGIPDAILGQAVKALVVLRPESGLTAADLQRHCAGCLEPALVPKTIEFRQALEKTATGKIRADADLQEV